MKQVFWLATEYRDRTAEYMVEIRYILGFKLATGRFAYGSAHRNPDGYGEPLPPGWSAPDKPRPINHLQICDSAIRRIACTQMVGYGFAYPLYEAASFSSRSFTSPLSRSSL